ncbi:MAG TPA: serine hydrolase domain-containing protein [Micropepsaceae bacterium]|nr:serine hydrolase domain-containing protein [Micropepsaceae bacterium]
MDLLPIRFLRAAALILACSISSMALAQSSTDLPPIAAPTSRVDVGSIPLVRSQSQQAGDYISGLLRGLRADERVLGIGVTVVQKDHPPLNRATGSVTDTTVVPAAGMGRLFQAVAILQLVEKGRLKPGQDIGALLDGQNSGLTLSRLLARGDDRLIRRVLEKASGMSESNYLEQRIFQPLGMAATHVDNRGLRTSLGDLARLAAALVNQGTLDQATVLTPSSVGVLEKSSPEIPGWSFGLPELQRNGRRALQMDGSAEGFSVRLVVAPDAGLAYAIAVRGPAGTRFWRALDEGVFDELLPAPGGAAENSAAAVHSQTADAIAGTYEPDRELRSLVFLKSQEGDLRVRAGSGGALVLAGAENITLLPQGGGGWAARDGSLSATLRGDELFLSSGAAYRPVALYKRPVLYALLALAAALGVIGATLFGSIPLPLAWFDSRSRDLSVN